MPPLVHHALLLLAAICVYTPILLADGYGGFPGRSGTDRLRKGNCSECKQMLELKVAQELPRLMLIRKRILSAVGRAAETEPQAPKALELKQAPLTTPAPPQKRSYYKYKILSPSEAPHDKYGNVILKFSVDAGSFRRNEEAVGASLLLFVDRRRKIKKGGKGKKIFLEVSKLNADNETWNPLTYLRTRVKKRRLKRISLPVNVAQQLLKSDTKTLHLKVKCIGCGRLVQLVIHKDADADRGRTRNQNKRHSERRTKGRKNSSRRRKNNPSATPELRIRTRYRL